MTNSINDRMSGNPVVAMLGLSLLPVLSYVRPELVAGGLPVLRAAFNHAEAQHTSSTAKTRAVALSHQPAF